MEKCPAERVNSKTIATWYSLKLQTDWKAIGNFCRTCNFNRSNDLFSGLKYDKPQYVYHWVRSVLSCCFVLYPQIHTRRDPDNVVLRYVLHARDSCIITNMVVPPYNVHTRDPISSITSKVVPPYTLHTRDSYIITDNVVPPYTLHTHDPINITSKVVLP